MKNPRYLFFSIATIIMCLSCGITAIYIFLQLVNGSFPILWGIIGIISSICIFSLVVTTNSLIDRLSDVTEKVVELEDKLLDKDVKEED